MRIYLVGLPGVGKSYWGNFLAAQLSFQFIDLDDEIVKSSGKSIVRIFEEDGEDAFRRMESEALIKTTYSRDVVIATGGGTPCFHNNIATMKEAGITIYMKDTISAIARRLMSQKANRPLFTSTSLNEAVNALLNLLANRRQYYEQTHIITGIEAFEHPHLLTNRLELFTKP